MQAPNAINRRVVNLLISNLASFAILAVFIGAAFAVSGWLKPDFSDSGLVITGVLMALVPAGVWLFFFYRQDRHEPEPKGMVMQVFILGALLAAAIGIPLVEDGFDVSSWMYSNPWVSLAASILLIGFVQEFLKFAAVRFSVYPTVEFNERTDGVIYSIAAGLGFALVLNFFFIINSRGADLGMAAVRLTLTSLAQASFAGVSGYFLAREKLDGKPAWWVPLGVVLAALLNGLFFFLWGQLTRPTIASSGAFVNVWAGLILAGVLALLTMAVLTWLIQGDQARHSEHPRRGPEHADTADRNLPVGDLPPFMRKSTGATGHAVPIGHDVPKGHDVPEGQSPLEKSTELSALVVIGVTLLALFFGLVIKDGQQYQTRSITIPLGDQVSGISASYPSNWQIQHGLASEELLFSVSDPFQPALRYSVSELPLPADGGLDMLAMQRNLQRGGQLPLYRIFEQSPMEYKDAQSGYMVHFAYVDARGTSSLPLVVEGVEYYLQYTERVLLVTLEDDSHSFTLDQPAFTAFLDSFVVGGK